MSFDFEPSEAEELAGGGSYLSEPGTYMLNVLQVREGQGPKGNEINGFSVLLEVVAGTNAGHEGETLNLTFWQPKLDQSERAQAMDRRKITAFLVATNQLDPQHPKSTFELADSVGEMVVAKLVPQQDKDGNDSDKYLQLNYSDIWHIDDPDCPSIATPPGTLDGLPPQSRKPQEFFAFKAKKKPASRAPQVSSAPPQQQPASGSADDYLADL